MNNENNFLSVPTFLQQQLLEFRLAVPELLLHAGTARLTDSWT